MSDAVGAGFVAYLLSDTISQKFRLHPACSSLQAEAVGLYQALVFLSSIDQGCTVNIFSDCLVLLNCLAHHKLFLSILTDCYNAFFEASRRHYISLCWCRGHSGNPGNDYADRLAKQGAAMSPRRLSHSRVRAGDVFHFFRHSPWADWDREARAIPSHLANYGLSPLVFRNNRFLTVDHHSIVGALTGHTWTHVFRFRAGHADSSDCPRCPGVPETVDHVVFDCPDHSGLRSTLNHHIDIRNLRGPERLQSACVDKDSWSAFRKFIYDCKRFWPPGQQGT
jgi:ribonuclease HI